MGNKDIISKELIKEIGRDISMHILGIELEDEITLIDKEWTRVEKRDSDIVFLSGKKIIHIEIQNDNHKKMELRMLRYFSDILFEYNGYEIEQYVIYIGKASCKMKNQIEQKRISYSYDIIDVREIQCERLLYHSNPSAVALSILCDFEGKDKQMVVNTILKRIRELTKNNNSEYKNYLEKVTILSTNRDLEENVKQGAKMLTVDIEKIPFYQDGLKEGIRKGIREGISEGIQKGIKSGVEKVAISMLKLNVELEIIQKATGLTLEEIEKLRQKI